MGRFRQVWRSIVVGTAAFVVACSAPTPAPTTAPTGARTTPTVSDLASSAASSSAGASPSRLAPSAFVALSGVDSTISQDIRYNGDHNFVGRPIDGYQEPLCILTRKAANALHRVQLAARARGYSLKVYDCYRPRRAGDDFAAWAARLEDQRMKPEFYPGVEKSALFNSGYVGGGPTSHSRGSAIDLTLVALPARTQPAYVPGEPLVACTAPAGKRFPDNTVDMGTGFDCFDSLSHTLDPRVQGPAKDNRLLLRRLMTDAGFTNYDREWWHYRLEGEPYPNTYFDFPVARGSLVGG